MKKLLLSALCSISLSLYTHDDISMNRGYLFAFEGTEGSGKTTLIENLKKELEKLNVNVVTTREPGATKLGKKIRTMLMDREEQISILAECLAFATDRAQHFAEFIIPNLQAKKVVLSDRMIDSSRVYQGYVKGLDQRTITTINTIAMQNHKPDLVLYLKLDCETALDRVNKRNETEIQAAFEKEILEKKQQLVDGYDAILSNRNDVVILDATASAEEIKKQALAVIIHYMQNHETAGNRAVDKYTPHD